jgi:hypothetical protein
MKAKEAELLLKQEVASRSPLGVALLTLLEDAELQNYRQSSRTADPYVTARVCGRGEGINSIIQRIAPVESPALNGRELAPPVAGEI